VRYQYGLEGVSFHFFSRKESVMSVVLEVSRKISLGQRDAQSILTRALKMGFTVRVASGATAGAVLPVIRSDSAASLGIRAVRGRKKKKTRGIYKIDTEMGDKMCEMRQDGLTIRAIARAFRLSTSGVGNYLKRREREAVA
jgi:hypothetical protein